VPFDPAEVPREVRGLRVAVLVTGGIAAYKVADVVSQLVQAGCQVRVAQTASAARFVGAATFFGLTGNPVLDDLWAGSGAPEPHVELGDWAQLVLIAPATANAIAKLARGESDDLASAALLASRAPVVVAPAMNDAMWANVAVQANVDLLRQRGLTVVDPESGHLASGHRGSGRLASASVVMEGLARAARSRYDLAGLAFVVTAGGTREPIDPVRYLSNYSSGKMGQAVAEVAAERGARVELVSAAQHPPHPGIRLHSVETAEEMLSCLRELLPGTNVLVMAAAVADYRPRAPAERKIRREERLHLELELERNVDVLGALATDPLAEGVFRVGFAAEDSELERNARAKLERKRVDAMVANDIGRRDIGFGSDYNQAVVFFRDGTRVELPRSTKRDLAGRLLDLLRERVA
jgi:phosphopantothenoylcysteine decarboxylase/phosphopantothenate--cysteine ligase